jgi:hypothetical protein
MTDLRRVVQDNRGTPKQPTRANREPQRGRSRTAGTDRDFDEKETSENQGHGHPREEHRPQVEHPGG